MRYDLNNPEHVAKLIKRAKYAARRHPEIAEDFSAEVLITFVKKPNCKSTLDQLYWNYLRKAYGDTRSVSGHAKSFAQRHMGSLDEARDVAGDSGVIEPDGGFHFVRTGDQKIDSLYEDYFVHEKQLKEIAEERGISVSYAHRWVMRVKKEMEKQAILQECLPRMQEPSFLSWTVDWLVL